MARHRGVFLVAAGLAVAGQAREQMPVRLRIRPALSHGDPDRPPATGDLRSRQPVWPVADWKRATARSVSRDRAEKMRYRGIGRCT